MAWTDENEKRLRADLAAALEFAREQGRSPRSVAVSYADALGAVAEIERLTGERVELLANLGTGKVWVCPTCTAVSPAAPGYEVGISEPCALCGDGIARVVMGTGATAEPVKLGIWFAVERARLRHDAAEVASLEALLLLAGGTAAARAPADASLEARALDAAKAHQAAFGSPQIPYYTPEPWIAVVRAVDASRPGLTEEQVRCRHCRATLPDHTPACAVVHIAQEDSFPTISAAYEQWVTRNNGEPRGETGPAAELFEDIGALPPRAADPPQPDRPSGLTRAMHDAAQRPSVAAPPKCPGPDCKMCNGEACGKCGAGCWNNAAPHCAHSVDERHDAPDFESIVPSKHGGPEL